MLTQGPRIHSIWVSRPSVDRMILSTSLSKVKVKKGSVNTPPMRPDLQWLTRYDAKNFKQERKYKLINQQSNCPKMI